MFNSSPIRPPIHYSAPNPSHQPLNDFQKYRISWGLIWFDIMTKLKMKYNGGNYLMKIALKQNILIFVMLGKWLGLGGGGIKDHKKKNEINKSRNPFYIFLWANSWELRQTIIEAAAKTNKYSVCVMYLILICIRVGVISFRCVVWWQVLRICICKLWLNHMYNIIMIITNGYRA